MRDYVVAFTPSPSLDLSGTVDRLRPNEKSYVFDEVRSPGGNAINAARILTRLHTPVLAIGFLGGSTGEEIKHLLEQEGVKNEFVRIKGHSRICVTVSNRADHRQTRLTFPGPMIREIEEKDLLSLLGKRKGNSFLIIGGSLPPGFHPSDVVKVMRAAKKNGIKCIVDSPGKVLQKLIVAEPFFIKPNLSEFQELMQVNVKTIGSIRRLAQTLLKKVPYVCVSSVEGGALLMSRDETYFGRIPKVKVKSSVGAGDSMVGAIVAQLYRENFAGGDLLRWGLAGAAATLEQPGTAFGSASRIHRLYKSTKVELVK